MALVRAAAVRRVWHFKDAAGHRLPSEKDHWMKYSEPGPEMDCPKCPDEPEPAKVECDSPQYHDGRATKWYRYCPRCGVRLPEA